MRRFLSYQNVETLLTRDRNYYDIDNYFKKEIKGLSEFLLLQIKESTRKLINRTYFLKPENKLDILKIALSLNIEVPNTNIVSTKNYLYELLLKGSFIVKGISGAETIFFDKKYYSAYTSEILIDDLKFVNETFSPCLVQEKLDKQFEIRSFYLNKTFYSMAIFSQEDDQTKLDFRVYNTRKMNRMVPYKLPNDLEIKLVSLLKKLKLETASLDLIRTKDNRFVFLEINPDGQFGMVSKPCNYFLEKKMAEFLKLKLETCEKDKR